VSQDTVVNYSMSGKAREGSDYTLSGTPGQIMISAGQSSGSVTLSALIDNKKEKKGESAIMTLQPGSGYDFASASSAKGKKKKKSTSPSAVLTILD
jgi:hypothetical protein